MPAESLIDEIVEIADTPEFGIKKVTKADGSVEQTEADMIEHRRLRIDTRKWAAAKMAPKKYGEKSIADVNVNMSIEELVLGSMGRWPGDQTQWSPPVIDVTPTEQKSEEMGKADLSRSP